MSREKLSPIRLEGYQPLRDMVFDVLMNAIMQGQLSPGERLLEVQLADEMGVSRTPVREALIELSKVEIIESHPQRKSTVSLIDYDLVEESRFMRNLLECAVVELDCRMSAPADLERLEENIRIQRLYLDDFYSSQLVTLDNQFHGMLFDIAKKSQVFALIQNISVHFDRVRTMALSSVKNGKIVQDHIDIVDAIRRRDPEAARALMETHLNRYDIDAAASARPTRSILNKRVRKSQVQIGPGTF